MLKNKRVSAYNHKVVDVNKNPSRYISPTVKDTWIGYGRRKASSLKKYTKSIVPCQSRLLQAVNGLMKLEDNIGPIKITQRRVKNHIV